MDTVRKVIEASTSRSRFAYDVFLSFRGEDTRKNFTDHLYMALRNSGFRTFRDDNELKKGERLPPQLDKAIRESEISVIIFSRDYASSTWCLNEVAMIMECNRTGDHKVLPVFYDVDPTDVRKQTGSFKDAFDKHEERFMNDINKVKRWREALRETAELVGMPLQNQANGHEAQFIKNIVKELDKKMGSRHVVLSVAPFTIGSDSIVNDINCWLQDGSNDVSVGMIHGMGGIEKTNIAKIAYNINHKNFEGSSFVADVKAAKKDKHLVRLQKQVCLNILKETNVIINNSAEGSIKIKQVVSTRKVLLVLDDVDELKLLYRIMGIRSWYHPGSKILVTTRNKRVVMAPDICRVFNVELMNFDQSLQLFCWHAFGQNDPGESLKKLSISVVRFCKGLPLALEVLGRYVNAKSKKLCNEEEDTINDELNMEAIYGSIIQDTFEFFDAGKELCNELEEISDISEILTVPETIHDYLQDLFPNTEVQEPTTSDELNMEALYGSVVEISHDSFKVCNDLLEELEEISDIDEILTVPETIYDALQNLFLNTEVQEPTTSNELNGEAIYGSIIEVISPIEKGLQWLFGD